MPPVAISFTGKTDFKLDPDLYDPDSEELAFYKSQTGITDDEALKRHILDLQARAYQIHEYPCIRLCLFMKLKISRSPSYQQVIRLGKERDGAILLDVGSCFGNDIRKVVSDGWPAQNTIGADIIPEFWTLGHDLFKDTPESFPATFLPGDVFDTKFISPRGPFYEAPSEPRPDLTSLTSLIPLQGHISVIHASSFFHLFDEQGQYELGKQIASLLSPLPGSIILGSHVGLQHKGLSVTPARSMFCHSPDSWKELWDGQIFSKGTVYVGASLTKRPDGLNSGYEANTYWLWWSVTRL